MRLFSKTLLTVILLCLGYGGTWFYFSNVLTNEMHRNIENLKAEGYEITYKDMNISGFPTHYVVKVKDIDVNHEGLLRLNMDGDLVLESSILAPRQVRSTTSPYMKVVLFPGKASQITLNGNGLKFYLYAKDNPRFEISYDDVSLLSSQGVVARSKAMDLSFLRSDATTIESKCMIKNLEFPLVKEVLLNKPISSFEYKAALSGNVKGNNLAQALDNWQKNAGALDIEYLKLDWGKLKIAVEGTVTLDQNLQPEAAFSADISGLDDLLEALIKVKAITFEMASIAKLGIGFLTGQAKTGDGHRIAITIQNEKLSIGPVSMMQMPKIHWNN